MWSCSCGLWDQTESAEKGGSLLLGVQHPARESSGSESLKNMSCWEARVKHRKHQTGEDAVMRNLH